MTNGFDHLKNAYGKTETHGYAKIYSDKESLYKYLYDCFKPFKKKLKREISDDDLQKLTQIPMIRITRFDSDKAGNALVKIEDEIEIVKDNLANLIQYSID